MKFSSSIFLILACTAAMAQDRPGAIAWSTELDVVPYATGGWYGSLAGGLGTWRLRGVLAEVHPPSAFEPRGWGDGRTRAAALLVDRFFRPGFTGPWLGSGVERWQQRLRPDGQADPVTLRTFQATLGAGWVFRMGDHLTINPWLAAHERIAGDRQASADGRICRPNPTEGEASLKVGWAW
ncbi:MAG: hypothetical protein P4L36_18315 [Holophaga sp.]|nr:hypothetical protein [Holophaga sp.]